MELPRISLRSSGLRADDNALKLAVEAAGENVDRATVGVIGGVGDQLVIRGQRQYLGVRA